MLMKKRILIVVGSFSMGGTISSLRSLLSEIDTDRIQVDLFCRLWKGDFKGIIPNCNILRENIWLSNRMTESCLVSKFVNFFLWTVRKSFSFLGVDLFRLYCKIGGKQIGSEKYAAIIGYDETLAQFTSSLPARKRINWIHCDYRRYANGRDESRYYDKIDTIVCVSEFAKSIFNGIYPQFKGKTVAIHNVINVEDIVERSRQPIDDTCFDTSAFTIISCGRLNPVKQFSTIPSIAKEIVRLTDKTFKWYIIGDGNERENIEREIIENGISESVILLGKKSNPYPYMTKADLYVCTSFSESFPLVVNEAKALRVPVVCNNFPSAPESIIDGKNGIITTIDKMPGIIAGMMDCPIVIQDYKSENTGIFGKIYELFES